MAAKLPFITLVVFLLQLAASHVMSQPASLSGMITNGVNGLPIVGAKVTVNGQSTYSVAGGNYSLHIPIPGTFVVTYHKTGFDSYTSSPVFFPSGVTINMDVQLLEAVNPSASLSAVIDSNAGPSINLTWLMPSGNYEVLYDDGIEDDFIVWAAQGNMNAVKYTPVGYPASVTGGSVNIGLQSNYPVGSNPFVPFQVSVFNDAGPNGTPGSLISGPVDVIPAAFGWIEFDFSTPVVVNSGSFYLVMVQGGNAPNAAGVAIDLTVPKFRSFQRFVTGNGPWIPSDGNFLLRATVNGPGGPLEMLDDPASVIDFQVWRLKQGEEMNPMIWTSIGAQPGTAMTDFAWPSLPCGPFRWAVRTHYSGNRWSPPTFSNVIGKCWTTGVTINVDLSCSGAGMSGTNIELTNLVYPDTSYLAFPDTAGVHLFPAVWKGTYELKVSRFNYLTYTSNINITYDTTVNVVLLQERAAPSNLSVNSVSLKATWNQPVVSSELFSENWSSGSFSANNWSIEGGSNWIVSQTVGNPAPSAMFGWSPQATNYEQSLISKEITGENSQLLSLKYDISLDNFGTTHLNQMAVEIWDGNVWKQLKKYDNSKGNISWISESLSIFPYTNLTFKFRFRAFGEDTYDIDAWYIDNISIVAGESSSNMAACIMGYNFYLNNALVNFVGDTVFYIPGNLVQYGLTYNACVEAVYGSGNSNKTCVDFTSQFLIPPDSLEGEAVEDAAFLSWNKPLDFSGSGPPPGLLGYNLFRDNVLLDSILNPDSLSYYDLGLDPGIYSYGVSSIYDLSTYGFPGQLGVSVMEGPIFVELDYGRMLPFYEPWNQGTFAFNEWSFDPVQGNWSVNTSEGNPLPTAEFSWEPPLTDYSYSLQTVVLSANNINCADVWFDFDYRFQGVNHTGTEKLQVELYYSNRWHELATYSNVTNLPWTSEHMDIGNVKGKSFKIRFTATGEKSSDILSWNVDNINVYAVCHPAQNLTGDASGYDVNLTWSPPTCGGNGLLLNEGFEGADFPPPNWTKIVTDSLATWTHAYITSYWGAHSGNYSAGILSDYSHQDEWLIAHNIEVTGPLQFWSLAHPGSTHLDHYFVKLSYDQGQNWITLLDLSALPAYPGPGGYNQWNEPYIINMSAYMGDIVDIAWHAVDGDGQGLWYNWAIDDCSIGNKKIHFSQNSRSILGYDLFRQDFGTGNYSKVNGSLITDTTYTDVSLNPGEYKYFVNAQLDECSLITSSDTVTVDVVTALDSKGRNVVTAFPNPASTSFKVAAPFPITSIEVLDFTGEVIQRSDPGGATTFFINSSPFAPGVYLVKVYAAQSFSVLKVVILQP